MSQPDKRDFKSVIIELDRINPEYSNSLSTFLEILDCYSIDRAILEIIRVLNIKKPFNEGASLSSKRATYRALRSTLLSAIDFYVRNNT